MSHRSIFFLEAVKEAHPLEFDFLTSQEPWLICSYTGTSAVLARKLAPGTRGCRLTLDQARNFEAVLAISCKE